MYARICCALIVSLFAAHGVFGQSAAGPEPCKDTETLESCFDRIQRLAAPEAVGEAVRTVDALQQQAVKQELATAQTGVDSVGTATASTVTDLAQLLNAIGLLSSSDEGSKLAVDLNFLLPIQDVENNNAQLKAVINAESTPLDQLVQAFPETIREARKDSLQKDISAVGDAQIAFTWSLVNDRFGRDYSVLRGKIAQMNEGAVNRGRSAARRDLIRAFPQVIQRRNEAVRLGNAARSLETPSKPAIAATASFGDLPLSNEVREELKAATFNAANERAAITQSIQAELTRSGFDRIAELIEEQPQLLFSLAHDIRDDIVGPETTSAKVTWELTRRNFSAFHRHNGKLCADPEVAQGGPKYDQCVAALQSYLGMADRNVNDQWRYKLVASYKRLNAVTYSFPSDNINLVVPKQDRWEVAFAAGKPMSSEKNGGRLDFELAYDSNLDDDTGNSERVRASLTYTQRLGDMDMPFSIIYANKDEFLGDIDHQISLNFGLRFRQPKN